VKWLRRTFASLANHNYRLFFIGQTISNTGSWMQKVAQALLVLELTDSGVLLGVTLALQTSATLFVGPWGGLLADRLNKHKVLMWSQVSAALPALLLAALTLTDQVQMWMVLVLAAALGVVDAVERPVRQTFVSEIVGGELLANAVTLNNVMINVGKVTGPAVAGILIGTMGLAAAFLINAGSYVPVLIALLLMRRSELHPSKPANRAAGQLRAGWHYVQKTPELAGPLVLLAVTGMFVYEWTVTLPLFARGDLSGDAEIVGLLFSVMGIGAVVGGLLVADKLRITTNGILFNGFVFGVLVTILAFMPGVPAELILLFLVGAASIAFRAVTSSFLQLRADPQMRGRVVSLAIVAINGTTPIGAPLMGWVSENLGARFAFGLGGTVTLIATLMTYRYLRRSRATSFSALAAGTRHSLRRPTRRG
jgi:MFS family permease